MKTIVNFILDETGSMNSCKEATISGFNEYVEGLKKQKEVTFSLTRFNSNKVWVEYADVPIKDVKELTDYNPAACTPLFDAIGRTITKVSAKIKRTQKKEKAKVLCIIMTDGEENSSKEYTRKKVFSLIKAKEKDTWSFVYLGADQDAWSNAKGLGLLKGNVMAYCSSDTTNTMRDLGESTVKFCLDDGLMEEHFFEREGVER